MQKPTLRSTYRAPALDKGLDIIELLALSSVGLTQAKIASHLKKSVNEIYRMLNTLRERILLMNISFLISY
jgi:DNA-binding IclR family transcriptional regulator